MSEFQIPSERLPEHFKLLLEAFPTPYLVLSPEFTILAASDSYLKATMTLRADILGKSFFDVFPDNPDDTGANGVINLGESLRRVLRTQAPDQMPIQRYDIRVPAARGCEFEERYWSPLNTPVKDSSGEIAFIIHRVEDVTDFVKLSKMREEAESHSKARAIEAEKVEAELDRRAEEVPRTNAETELALSLLKSEQISRGKAQEAAAIAHLVAEQLRGAYSARHEADEALRISEARLQGIIGSAMDGIISVDEHQRIVVFNKAAEQMFLCPVAEALGHPLEQFIPMRFREAHREHVSKFGTDRVTTRSFHSPSTLTALRSNGEEFPIEATISQVQAAGQMLFTVILRDVTERKRAEERLRQVQKMEAIGQLAGGVAHDFNTLLNIILGYSELVLSGLPEDHSLRGYVEQIKDSADTGALLTKQLLAFSRKQALAPQVVDLSKAVRNLAPMLRRLLREDITLSVRCSEHECPVKTDPGHIQQLVLNLAVNARDAMPQGGNLTVEVRAVELDETCTQQHSTLTPGKYQMLAVSDTGVGMDRETASRIFEPFFTTKATGGTGLGLATVYGIVKLSGGDVWVYSEPGIGTAFKIYLPQASGAIKESKEPKREPRRTIGTETILLVEDSAALRELTRVLLSREGYVILEAADGVDALELARNYDGQIDLLITDIVMPRMRGPELVSKITQQRPGIAVLFLSGYTEEAMARHPQTARFTVLEKPYTMDSLRRSVRQTLDETQANNRSRTARCAI